MIFDEANFPDLPESWTSLLVEDACDNISVKQKTKTDKYLAAGRLAVVDQGAKLIGGYINNVDESVTADLPVIIFGDHTRAIKYIDFPFAAGADGIKVLKPKEFYAPKLFYQFLRAIRLPNKGYARHFQFLRSSKITLPPLDEQKRIAEKLNSLLARVDACQTHLERVPQILKRFRQSVLAAATSGRLTEDWREKKGIDFSDWETTDFDSVCNEITVGYVGKMASEYREEGIPFLRSLNVRPFRFDPKDLKFISKEFHKKISKSILHPGDVVIVRSGAPGQCCVIPSDLPEANCSDLVIARVGSKLLPEFAVIFINSEVSQSFVRSEQVGVAQQHFNVGSMKKAPLHLPSIEEQSEIVRRIEKLFAYAERLEVRYTSASEHVERLTPSLLGKAFRGELVEQDAGDESAEILLERIQATRDALPAKAKRPIKSKEPRNYTMEETLEEIIQYLPKDTFSFEDLREKFSGDYETLKEQLFTLLNDENPIISQVFDKSAEAMRFVRRKK